MSTLIKLLLCNYQLIAHKARLRSISRFQSKKYMSKGLILIGRMIMVLVCSVHRYLMIVQKVANGVESSSNSLKHLNYLYLTPRDINGTYTFNYQVLDTVGNPLRSVTYGIVVFTLEFIGYV